MQDNGISHNGWNKNKQTNTNNKQTKPDQTDKKTHQTTKKPPITQSTVLVSFSVPRINIVLETAGHIIHSLLGKVKENAKGGLV